MRTPKILHVDDDGDILEVVRLALETIGGLSVVQCSSAAEALQRAPEVNPDLFLLDLMMPGISGEELFLELRKTLRFSVTPAVFLTAVNDDELVRHLLSIGAADVISKPFDVLKLAPWIISVWSRVALESSQLR